MFPFGRSSRATMPLATGSPTPAKTIGIVRVSLWTATVAGVVSVTDVGLRADQLLRERLYPIGVTTGPTKVDPHVAAIGPTQVRDRLSERGSVSHGIVFVPRYEHADVPYAVAPLRAH